MASPSAALPIPFAANDVARAHKMLEARPELANMAISYGDEHRPIHFAVMNRLPEMVGLLMQHGANARAGIDPHRDATTAWMLARDRGYDEIIAVIEDEERRQKPPEVEEQQETRGDEDLRAAVAEGNLEWLRALHAAGTLANPIRWDGGGLLTVAVEHGRPDILTFLLDCGFDPNERVSEGEGDWIAYSQGYPLWTCAALGRRDLAEILLARCADPNVHVDSSGSAVYSAYSHSSGRWWIYSEGMAAKLPRTSRPSTGRPTLSARCAPAARPILPKSSALLPVEVIPKSSG